MRTKSENKSGTTDPLAAAEQAVELAEIRWRQALADAREAEQRYHSRPPTPDDGTAGAFIVRQATAPRLVEHERAAWARQQLDHAVVELNRERARVAAARAGTPRPEPCRFCGERTHASELIAFPSLGGSLHACPTCAPAVKARQAVPAGGALAGRV